MRGFLVTALLLAGCSQVAPSPGENQTGEMDRAHAAVLADLVDPASADFGPSSVLPSGIVCGSVNARNRMGGYAGRSAWYYDPRRASVYVVKPGQNAYGEAWDAKVFRQVGCPSGLEHWLSDAPLMKIVDENWNRAHRTAG